MCVCLWMGVGVLSHPCREGQMAEAWLDRVINATGKVWETMEDRNPGHQTRREVSLEKTQKLRQMEGQRRRGRQRMKWLDRVINARGKLQETMEDRESCPPVATKREERTPWRRPLS